MNLYLITYAIIVVLLIISLVNKKYLSVCYAFAFILMSALLIFRYGQGTDYLSYAWIYSVLPDNFNHLDLVAAEEAVTTEKGWNILCIIAKSCGIEFKYFTAIISAVEMLLINRFIRKMGNNRYKILALLLMYPAMYIIYMFSILREGLVICVFLGLALPWFAEKKYILYALTILLLSTIHIISIVFFVLFIINVFSIRQLKLCVIPSFIIGYSIARYGTVLFSLVGSIIGKEAYIDRAGISWIAIFERLFMLIIILYLFTLMDNDDRNTDIFVKCYIAGVCLYFCLMAISLTASRIGILFKVLELWLIPQMIIKTRKDTRITLLSLLIAVTCFITVKNINSEIAEGGYYEGTTVTNYPYVTIFDDKDKIDDYRFTMYSDWV